jgi:hypothetical protein
MSDKQHRQSSPHGSSRGGAASNKPRQGAAHKTAGSVVQQGKRSDSGHQAPQTPSMQELSTSPSKALKKIEELERSVDNIEQVIRNLRFRVKGLEDRNHQRE